MKKHKNIKTKKIVFFFSFLLTASFGVFIFSQKISATSSSGSGGSSTGSYPCTGYNYSDWTTTCHNGYYTRYVINGIPFGCVGTAPGSVQPETSRPCASESTAPSTCAYVYSSWSSCQTSGTQTRTVLSSSPSNCVGTPITQQNCTYHAASLPCTSYTYGSWSACQTDSTQTRNILSNYPTGCLSTSSGSATPITRQTCTASSTETAHATIAPTCTFSYSEWESCQSNNIQVRTVSSTSPSGCSGGTPVLQRNCTYTAPYSSSQTTQTADQSTAPTSSLSTTSGGSSSTSSVPISTAISSTPEFSFYYMNENDTLKDSFTIKGSVSEARSVEFNLVPIGSNIFYYIGSAKNTGGDFWEYSFDTKSFFNGYFYLTAKITNAYGSYISNSKIKIKIENLDSSGSTLLSETAPEALPEESSVAIPANFNGLTSAEWQKNYFGQENCLEKSDCRGEADPDKDGLSNNDEFRYRTHPLKPDTDEDKFLDGDEVKNGFNPLQFSPGDRSDKMLFENPKETGEIKKELYKINTVEMVSASDSGQKELRLSGKGIPNSFVSIYIYSNSPIVLTVKTDANGNWSYVLDKQLDDGEHQIYVAVTDNTGKITAKSEPLFFVKTAEAATVIPAAEASSIARSKSPVEKRKSRDMMIIAAIIIMGFIVALTAIGFFIIHSHKKAAKITFK